MPNIGCAGDAGKPAQFGAFGCPTTVSNVETLAILPTAINLGGDAFSRLSDLHHFKDGGVRLFGVSGHVKKPGLYECAVGLTLRELEVPSIPVNFLIPIDGNPVTHDDTLTPERWFTSGLRRARRVISAMISFM